MATNPIPKGTKNLSINIPTSLHASLRKQAEASGLSLSAYVRRILELAYERDLRFEVSYKVVSEGSSDFLAVAESPPKKSKEKGTGSSKG